MSFYLSAPRRPAPHRNAAHRPATQRNVASHGGKKKMFRATPEYEADVAALAACLRAVSIDGIVPYAEFDTAIGRPVRHQRYLLNRARDIVEKEEGAVFAAVHGRGLKRLPVAEYPTVGQHARRTIRRKAGRAMKRMENGIAKANDAPAEVVRAVNREQTVLGLVRLATRDTTLRKRLEAESADAPTPLGHAARLLMEALGVKPMA